MGALIIIMIIMFNLLQTAERCYHSKQSIHPSQVSMPERISLVAESLLALCTVSLVSVVTEAALVCPPKDDQGMLYTLHQFLGVAMCCHDYECPEGT